MKIPFLPRCGDKKPLFFNVCSLGGDLNNENIYSLEAGYVGRFSDDVTLRIDTFYQRMEHLIGAVNTLEYVLGIFPVTTTQLVNTGGANAYGIEAELKTKLGNKSSLSAWYSYNEIDFDEHAQIVRAFKPAKHKTGLLYRRFVDKSRVFNLNYSNSIFSTAHEAASSGDAQYSLFNEAEAINCLDLSLSRKFLRGDGELMIGAADVLNKTAPVASDYTNFAGYKTPGRCFFVRVQLGF
jgi:outer membrane receptor protein involved in Fe transport